MNEKMDKMVQEMMRARASYIDALIAAYLRETGLRASEICVVERQLENKWVWAVEPRSDHGPWPMAEETQENSED